ncbi:MAG: MlaD family protein [Phycisphaerales bacterium]|nr:MlaD family protein [Phycisphaerales bacterium]|tara:strand:+ start:3575 stop:4888 length:1314 start_codon:yes stop_codon:yes gene_type:complete
MSNESLRQANNVKAGVFVTIALFVGLFVIFLLGDLWTVFFGPSMNTYETSYAVVDGVSYLQKGSEVRVGGIKTGVVEQVSFELDGKKPIEMIQVRFSLPENILLYSNAVAVVKSGLISADSFIAISSLGFDEANRPRNDSGISGSLLKSGDEFKGTNGGGMLASLLGTQATADVNSFLDMLNQVSRKMKQEGYVLKWVLGAPSAREVQDVIKNLDVVMADFQQKWQGQWSSELSSILTNVNASMTNVNEIIDRNDQSIDEIVANVRSLTTVAETEWAPKLTSIFSNGQKTLEDVQQVVEDVRVRSPIMLDNLGDSLANLNVGSQQLSRTITEVSASPWRLLYRPTDKEYSNELLYEAARNFSFGTADLKAATGSMRRLMDARGDDLTAEDQDFILIRQNLIDSFERYQRAQQQLMEILRGDGTVSDDGADEDQPGGS